MFVSFWIQVTRCPEVWSIKRLLSRLLASGVCVLPRSEFTTLKGRCRPSEDDIHLVSDALMT